MTNRQIVHTSIIRQLQRELGLDNTCFLSRLTIANEIAKKCNWPILEEGTNRKLRRSAYKYITRYINLTNQFDIKDPKCYVYFAQAGASVKIGVADNIDKRLKDLQTGNPIKIRLIAYIPALSKAHAYQIEHGLHRKFISYNVNGEWFHRTMIPKMLDIKEKVVWKDANDAERMVFKTT